MGHTEACLQYANLCLYVFSMLTTYLGGTLRGLMNWVLISRAYRGVPASAWIMWRHQNSKRVNWVLLAQFSLSVQHNRAGLKDSRKRKTSDWNYIYINRSAARLHLPSKWMENLSASRNNQSLLLVNSITLWTGIEENDQLTKRKSTHGNRIP